MELKGKTTRTGTERIHPLRKRVFKARLSIGRRGLSLIEVLLVLTTIGVLAGFAIPRIDVTTLFSPSVEGAAKMMASDIRYAQEFAMANRVSKSILFVSGTSRYTFSPGHGLDPEGQLPGGTTIQNSLTVTFNSLGEPVLGGGGSVRVSAGGQTKTVTISPYTGKVTIS